MLQDERNKKKTTTANVSSKVLLTAFILHLLLMPF